MAGPIALLTQRLQEVFDKLEPGADPIVRRSEVADFQANGALPLAKRLGRPPREVAADIVAALDLTGVCEKVEIGGPGFVNLTLERAFVADELVNLAEDERLGVEPAPVVHTVVVDYSAPNVAKEMAVHHIRTTIIGDAICRMLGSLGHHIVRANHIGDWGTPFGMLIENIIDMGAEKEEELSLGDLEDFYRDARVKFDTDEAFAARSRRRVVLLQQGDPETLRLWGLYVEASLRDLDEIYAQLGVLLTRADIAGESMYNPMLADVVADLDRLGLLVTSDGARCVFPPGFTNREGNPLPLIVQKSDGGFGYAATDLAAVRYRVDTIGADLLLYVIGAPQAEHLAMIFATARLAGWLPEGVEAFHVSFGSVLGPDHKILRTRAGDTVKLRDLLTEAVERAGAVIAEKNPDLPPAERDEVARTVGIGAVKYGDLSTDRIRDEVFDFERMLSFEGNTAPYLQYAHARICSILRRAEGGAAPPGTAGAEPPPLAEDLERALALELLSFDDALQQAVGALAPHRLCTYLFELAGTFTRFYEACPVLKAPDEATRAGRLLLCKVTARVLALGLGLLGIGAPERM
jgi:arginyl-tRNA synthetase